MSQTSQHQREQRHSTPLLYVEDDPDVRMSMEALLLDEGYQVVTLSTAEEALNELRDHHYDLFLTDYNLPHKNADWLLNVARRNGLLQDTAVVVLSAAAEPSGVDGYRRLRKPVDIGVLLTTLDEALEAHVQGARQAAEPTPSLGEEPGTVVLTLYITQSSSVSQRAAQNLRRVLTRFDPANVRLEVCDLADLSDSSLTCIERDRIVVTPTLVRQHPLPKVWMLGDLSKSELVEELVSAGLHAATRQRREPLLLKDINGRLQQT